MSKCWNLFFSFYDYRSLYGCNVWTYCKTSIDMTTSMNFMVDNSPCIGWAKLFIISFVCILLLNNSFSKNWKYYETSHERRVDCWVCWVRYIEFCESRCNITKWIQLVRARRPIFFIDMDEILFPVLRGPIVCMCVCASTEYVSHGSLWYACVIPYSRFSKHLFEYVDRSNEPVKEFSSNRMHRLWVLWTNNFFLSFAGRRSRGQNGIQMPIVLVFIWFDHRTSRALRKSAPKKIFHVSVVHHSVRNTKKFADTCKKVSEFQCWSGKLCGNCVLFSTRWIHYSVWKSVHSIFSAPRRWNQHGSVSQRKMFVVWRPI